MNATLRPMPALARPSLKRPWLTRPALRLPARVWLGMCAAMATCSLLSMMWTLPQPDTRALQTRQHALSTCNDALTTTMLTGQRVEGFRLVPSSITQEGQRMQADYQARLSGLAGWNSGPLRTVHCLVNGGQVKLSVLAP